MRPNTNLICALQHFLLDNDTGFTIFVQTEAQYDYQHICKANLHNSNVKKLEKEKIHGLYAICKTDPRLPENHF